MLSGLMGGKTMLNTRPFSSCTLSSPHLFHEGKDCLSFSFLFPSHSTVPASRSSIKVCCSAKVQARDIGQKENLEFFLV